MIYLDSSALVKRYIHEAGSEKVNALLAETAIAATSRLAFPEVLSAITRRHKAGDIAPSAFERTKSIFKADWALFAVVELGGEVFQFVESVIEKHALRGADSIHLSTALWLKKAMREEVTFVASDLELLRSAKVEKLKVCDPRD